MTSKLIYLIMIGEIFNYSPALVEGRGVIRIFQASTMERFAKIVSNDSKT